LSRQGVKILWQGIGCLRRSRPAAAPVVTPWGNSLPLRGVLRRTRRQRVQRARSLTGTRGRDAREIKMMSSVRQKVLRHLGAISMTVGAGCAMPATGLLHVPAEVVVDLVDDTENLSWRGEDKQLLLNLLANDPRASIRARVAESAGTLWTNSKDDTNRLLRRLAGDPAAEVQWAAARGLTRVLEVAAPVDRLQTVCAWTTSPHRAEREAVARALCHPTQILAADLAISSLAADADPRVRRHAARAAAVRFHENPTHYARLAADLASDPDSRVRRSARRLLRTTT